MPLLRTIKDNLDFTGIIMIMGLLLRVVQQQLFRQLTHSKR